MTKPDYVMVGGFLGAGKTTALLRLARHFTGRGRRVGLITNDQSQGLVDTTLVNASGYPVREITGGCFCCRFNSLTKAANELTSEVRPDVFLAEPVGSCTDLRATVHYPLRRMYGDNYRIAPLSVLVDPIRALRVLGLESGQAFSAKVLYVYRKQLEEADLIVINKRDLLDAPRLSRLEAALGDAFPRAAIFSVSAREGTGLAAWFGRLADDAAAWAAPEVDYDLYAEGEALLGWLNATVRLQADDPFDGNRLLRRLAADIHRRLAAEGLEIAHFKMTLAPSEDLADLGVLNLVGSDRQPEQPHLLQNPLDGGELIVNLRAEGDPDTLRAAVTDALRRLADAGVSAKVVHLEHFRPARPTPTHRVVTV